MLRTLFSLPVLLGFLFIPLVPQSALAGDVSIRYDIVQSDSSGGDIVQGLMDMES